MMTRDDYAKIDLLKYLRVTNDMNEVRRMIDNNILYEPELCALIVNPNITLDILCILTDSKYDSVREAVAKSPLVNGDIACLLCNDPNGKVRTALASNIHTPAGIIGTLSSDYNYYVRLEAYRNPILLRKYVKIGLESDRDIALAADNPMLLSTDLYYIANKKGCDEAKIVIAKRSDLPTPLFIQLSYSDNALVRRAVAANPFCDDETLIYLSCDSDSKVKEILLRRPYLPPEALSNFTVDDDKVIRRLAAKRDNLFLEDQNTLSIDLDRQVRLELMLNDFCDAHLKEQMELRDENQEIMININNLR